MFHLLKCVAGAVVKNGAKFLLDLVPGGQALYEIASDAWENLRKKSDVAALRGEVQALAQASAEQVRAEVLAAVKAEAGHLPADAQHKIATYLTQVPAMIRRSLRRPSDPTGTSVPSGSRLQSAEDLLPLLPPRPPRFKAGDRPLPGVDWELVELLGVGGFGEVWKARNAHFSSVPPVALKFCLDAAAKERLLKHEAAVLDRVMRQGKHPGIVPLQHTYLSADPPCLEYEYVDGGDLAGLIQELQQKGGCPPRQAARVIQWLAEVMGYAHRLEPPIVHRDLKPANILVKRCADKKIAFRITDFGIGGLAASHAIQQTKLPVSSRQTMLTDAVRGAFTPLYASPEQMRGEGPDPRDDVYALGVIWFQILTGNLTTGRPGGKRWRERLTDRGLPPRMCDLLEACFEEVAADRPRDAAVLAECLGDLLNAGSPTSPQAAVQQATPVPLTPTTTPPPQRVPTKPQLQPAAPETKRESVRPAAEAPPPSPTGVDEKPANFYLGREYDLRAKQVTDKVVEYDARDLTTHGVVVGMTGSGKTGLCISLLEEAAIDGIPCIVIDPKGDLVNLLLQFPDLAPEDFAQWVNEDEAHQKKLSLEEYARQTAARWRKGLEDSGQTAERIKLLKDELEWRVYTPGSEAGLPLSILQTFAAPKGKVPREALNQKIDATTTALLGLTGLVADPVQSREHILIANLLSHAWSKGRDLDLAGLISQIQEPPLSRIGALDIEGFYPEKARLKLAVALNNILAAPSFSTWIHGEPLDLSKLLASPTRKKRHLIFYVAHLNQAQRMFFITLLLEEVLSWTRRQPGTTTLRALLYFDEVFGYLPPHPANPPTKLPLMTLLKQARAFGVGVLLATQNPVDVDLEALMNARTWFVGKLQTERDKARLVEGLEGVARASGTLPNRAYLETVISSLGDRIFLLHDVHRGQPLLFQTRHTLSYLRGPMTREQISLLMEPLKEGAAESEAPGPPAAAPVMAMPVAAILLCRRCLAELPSGTAVCPKCGEPLHQVLPHADHRQGRPAPPSAAAAPVVAVSIAAPPSLPGDVSQYYIPLMGARPANAVTLVYHARLLGVADVAFLDKKRGLSHQQTYRLLAAVPPAGQAVGWHTAERLSRPPEFAPVPGAAWGEVPELFKSGKKLKALEKTLADFLYSSARLVLLENAKLGLIGQPGEDVVAFRARCRAAAVHQAEQAREAERANYAPQFAALGANMPDGALVEDGSLLGVLNPLSWFGSKEQKPRPGDKIAKLEAEWHGKLAALYEKCKQLGEDYTDVPLTPRRQDVQVTAFGLAWAPCWQVQKEPGRLEWVPAYR